MSPRRSPDRRRRLGAAAVLALACACASLPTAAAAAAARPQAITIAAVGGTMLGDTPQLPPRPRAYLA
ncbi:MAG: hypothetical protein ACOYD4_18005, partial [Solirubrobacterales bacterium]